MRIGLLGGTFDPIHIGHLAVAEEARHFLGLERVYFIPAKEPPHKAGQEITDVRHRYVLTLLATASNPLFSVSAAEIDRPGPSYTIDTLRMFRREFGPETELFFITGADAVVEILTWRSPEDLLREARFIGATRPGCDLQRLEAVRSRLPAELGRRIETLDVPALGVSSRELRQRVREGRPIKYLVPETVEAYIRKEGLYTLRQR